MVDAVDFINKMLFIRSASIFSLRYITASLYGKYCLRKICWKCSLPKYLRKDRLKHFLKVDPISNFVYKNIVEYEMSEYFL